jgi:DNA-binding NarL/FixJ family response regulator
VKNIRLLLVDDHELMRQLFRELISLHSQVDIVGESANGRDAVELADRVNPDVILMDISMPVMGGIEATRIIKSRHPDIRVIGLSMHDSEQMADTADSAGMDALVSKTASADELMEAIMASGVG